MLRNLLLFTLIGLQASYALSQKTKTSDAYTSISALKNGLTLGSSKSPVNYLNSKGDTIWKADFIYHNDIAGIGKDAKLNFFQASAHSANDDVIIKIYLANSNKGSLKNTGFLLWGNNDSSLVLTKNEVPSKKIQERLKREWKIQNSGVDKVNLSISLPDLYYSGHDLYDFELLITDENGDFTNDSLVQRLKADSISYGVLYFKNVVFKNIRVFTLATDIQHKPRILMPRNFSAEIGKYYRKTFRVFDKDHDIVKLTVKQSPGWLELINNKNGTYTMQGTPKAGNKELNELRIVLDDGIEEAFFLIEIPFQKPSEMKPIQKTKGELVVN